VGSNEETLWIGLHGFTGSGADFGPLVNGLPQGGSFEAPDLPGHGLSAKWSSADCVSMDACDAMLLERIQGLKNRRVVLMGYSMGGRVALHFASRFSHLLDAIVLIGANPGILDETQRKQRLSWEQELCTRLVDDGVPGFMAYWQELAIIRSQQTLPPKLLQAMQARRAQALAEGLIQSIRGMGTGSMRPLWRALPHIQCPLLFCAGEEDSKYRSLGEQVVSRVQNGKLGVIRGNVGHAAHLEGLEFFGNVLRDWFKESVLSI
jgi:2-succinyl-6-hydroxy-2,4-cyclohexadiene-1-carboxylate synthase